MTNVMFNEVSSEASFLPNAKIKPFIHPTATIRNSQLQGNITVEENVHIVNAALRADEGTPFFIGANSNIQDFVVLHAYVTQQNGKPIEENLVFVRDKGLFAIYINENTTVAHGALIHGPCYIGKNTFVGFKATIDAATIGSNVEIGAHAYIRRVTIPDGIGIAPNAVITEQKDVEKFTVPLIGLNEKIVKVNLEMAKSYNSLNR